MDRSDPGAGARARRWARLAKYLALGPLAVALLAAALLTSTPLLAQSSGRLIIGPSIGARTFSPQGLPPATMRD
jgi:hypothetical protein